MNIFGNSANGVVHFRGGELAHLMVSNGVNPGEFLIRYENGWHVPYCPDGTMIRAGYIIRKDGSEEEVLGNRNRDVVCFEEMSWNEAQLKYPGIAGNISP